MKDKSLDGIFAFNEEVVDFGVRVQTESSKKMEAGHHVDHNVYNVLYRVSASAIILHRSAVDLCLAGWAHVSPLLLRGQLECAVNCLVVINNDCPEYMAFKYLYHPYVLTFRDDAFSEEARKKAETDILTGIEKISDQSTRDRALEFVYRQKVPIFWFQPEEKHVSKIIEKYAGAGLKFTYKSLSMSSHVGHFGLLLFKDEPDKIEINPCENPTRTKESILVSGKFLLEFLHIRNVYEELALDEEFDRLFDKIDSLRAQ